MAERKNFTRNEYDKLIDEIESKRRSFRNNPARRAALEPSVRSSEELADTVAAELLHKAAVPLKDLSQALQPQINELRRLKADLEALKDAFADVQTLISALSPIFALI